MDPRTRIDLGKSKWLGVLAAALTVAGELLTIANTIESRRSFTDCETQKRAAVKSQAKVR